MQMTLQLTVERVLASNGAMGSDLHIVGVEIRSHGGHLVGTNVVETVELTAIAALQITIRLHRGLQLLL